MLLGSPKVAQGLVRWPRLSALAGEASGCGEIKMDTTAQACVSPSNPLLQGSKAHSVAQSSSPGFSRDHEAQASPCLSHRPYITSLQEVPILRYTIKQQCPGLSNLRLCPRVPQKVGFISEAHSKAHLAVEEEGGRQHWGNA